MPANDPAPAGTPRAAFGAMLRHYRTRAGLTQDQLGALAHVSAKLIGAYENGWRVPTRDATAFLDAVPELGTNGSLTVLWDQFQREMSYQAHPAWFQDWPEREAAATRLRWFEPTLVPGLLQTPDYARAVLSTRFGTTEEEVELRVGARLRRQEILDREKPPALWVILDEWMLRRPVGGAHVMCEQVERLLTAARRPFIQIEIIPAGTGTHDGLNGQFIIADFGDRPSVAYQEAALRGIPVTDPDDIGTLNVRWDTLKGEAVPRGSSLALLEEAAKSWTSAL